MKLEKLRINKKKKIVIGVEIFLCFISAIMFMGSRAKYKVTESIPLVNGTINYKPYDMKMVGIYVKNTSNGEYENTETIPTSGYNFNQTKSYCTTDGTNKDTSITISYSGGKVSVANLVKQGTKCYFYFDKIIKLTPEERIQQMGLTATEGATSFTGTSTTNEGLKSGTDDDGTTYYFRGNVTNNWVQFARFYWRIIRINGDGSIRMIYNGASTTTTGTGTQIGTSKYSTNYNDNAYVGYMYGSTGANTYAATHANTNNSTIKGIVDNWYKTNIADKGYGNKISTDAGFCNDRSIADSSETWWKEDTKKGYGKNATAYGPFSRVLNSAGSYNSTQTPSFMCKNASSDLFTVSSSLKGNKKLIYPVGLITSDEVVFAGGFGGKSNNSYYLYTTQDYWAMSPYHMYENGCALMFRVDSAGSLHYLSVDYAFGVRPVINLSSDVKLTGTGTTSDPYKVV